MLHLVYTSHSWLWLGACLAGELVAYFGYALTLRDMARVDDGDEMSLEHSAKAVVAGFGVFAATRGSGGFAVDYWAFRRAGAGRREAAHRVLGLGFLEYFVLSVAALVAFPRASECLADLRGGAFGLAPFLLVRIVHGPGALVAQSLH